MPRTRTRRGRACPLRLRDGAVYRIRLIVDDVQENPRAPCRLTSPLFPVAERGERETVLRGELWLRQTGGGSNRASKAAQSIRSSGGGLLRSTEVLTVVRGFFVIVRFPR